MKQYDSSENTREETQHSQDDVSLIGGHIPEENAVLFSIDHYDIISVIGKGGMGEVYLAYDRSCGRRIALKRIREDLVEELHLHERFLREARITSQLTHPAIIPIFEIHHEKSILYYTMPFVDGETLKEILRQTRRREKAGEPPHPVGGSIPALLRIFTTVCQAVAYAHSKGVLHRDIKPENIMIGRYGEVMILDWGLAKLFQYAGVDPQVNAGEGEGAQEGMTRRNKIVGTLTYMAPERALGHPASVQADIYALGVILYQLLTLRSPFRRENIKQFRKEIDTEELIDPEEVAPYREVPPTLSQVVRKCLAKDMYQRYQTVDALLDDLSIFLEGRAEWFHVADLHVKNKEDWQFQEHVLLFDHPEISRNGETSEWVNMMISKASLPDNIKLEANVRLGEKCHGIGFMLSVPEAEERQHLNDGYCIWLARKGVGVTKVLRTGVLVSETSDFSLKPNIWHKIRIEKRENNLYVYVNDILQFNYISHLPIVGTHVGLITQDSFYEISDFHLYASSHSLMVSCLAIPDAFLAYRDFERALHQYRRIGYSFPGRTEGREALFRAGVTLLERARYRSKRELEGVQEDLDEAFEAFSKLHFTPGAPLEYLGKALIYQYEEDYEEEVKCFELALRRYPGHALNHILYEKIVQRMHESARRHRLATYMFALLALRHLSDHELTRNAAKLFDSLKRHAERPLFFLSCPEQPENFPIFLAFWCAKPFILEELFKESSHPCQLGNILMGLIALGAWSIALELMKDEKVQKLPEISVIQYLIDFHQSQTLQTLAKLLPCKAPKGGEARFETVVDYLVEEALARNQPRSALKLMEGREESQLRTSYLIWAYLLENDWEKAGSLFESVPLEVISDEKTSFHFLYGCWLEASEGHAIAMAHFSGILEMPYPRVWSLLSHYLFGRKRDHERWFARSFLYEKKMLYRQLALYYHCAGKREKAQEFRLKDLQEVQHV